MYPSLGIAFLGLLKFTKASRSCPENPPLSCSEESQAADSCCVFSPGLLELSQVWNKERQRWVIDEIRVLSCDAITSYNNCGPFYSPEKIHGLVEGYARHREPMTSVSPMWARKWDQTGSCISTFQSKCFDKNMPPGEEEAWNNPGPALFVQMIHTLQHKLMRVDPPGLNELSQKWYYLHTYGSPHLGEFVEEPALTAGAEKQRQHIGKLSFFAQRERRRAEGEESRGRWIEHEEL
ncbi:hypothetical protein OPQ81_000283 [Rhizoctonia solani]|nr:hypothetical protein OPQ81_000283 [Rhizoctonia solani]